KKPSFPRRRESRTRNGGNIQRFSENSGVLDSRLRGNDGGAVSAFPINDCNLKPILPTKTEKQKPKIPSFSRKQLRRVGFSPPFFSFSVVDWRAEARPTFTVKNAV
ncbi:TPA: hypothetical protein ACJJ7H_001015, partial [Neisseria meningitidis]